MSLFKCKQKHITALDIAVSYNKHKENLRAVESKHCCSNDSTLVVVNQTVVLRRLLEDLGFSQKDIDDNLYSYTK